MACKTLTDRDFLKLLACETLTGQKYLTPEQRYAQACWAQRYRNFFFTATGQSIGLIVGAVSSAIVPPVPGFADPIVITDLISQFDMQVKVAAAANNATRFLLQIQQYGGSGKAYGKDFFGLSSPAPAEFIAKFEKSSTGNLLTTQPESKWLQFTPRMLESYETFHVTWTLQFAPGVDANRRLTPQLGFRAVRALKADNPYSYIRDLADREVRNYINGSDPETVLIEINFPFANIPAAGSHVPLVVQTDQQQRPLLVLGAATNLEGCQGDLFDESEQYQFTNVDAVRLIPAVANAYYDAPPLSLWAPNTDFRTPGLYGMWAMPHLLLPGASLKVKLYNGLWPSVNAPLWGSVATTRGSQNARIVFLCRTV